jgi:hypothetical protein
VKGASTHHARKKEKSCRVTAANFVSLRHAPQSSLAQMLERANNSAPQTCKIMRAAMPLGKAAVSNNPATGIFAWVTNESAVVQFV